MKFLSSIILVVGAGAFAPRPMMTTRPGTSLHVADDAKVVFITGGSQGVFVSSFDLNMVDDILIDPVPETSRHG